MIKEYFPRILNKSIIRSYFYFIIRKLEFIDFKEQFVVFRDFGNHKIYQKIFDLDSNNS